MWEAGVFERVYCLKGCFESTSRPCAGACCWLPLVEGVSCVLWSPVWPQTWSLPPALDENALWTRSSVLFNVVWEDWRRNICCRMHCCWMGAYGAPRLNDPGQWVRCTRCCWERWLEPTRPCSSIGVSFFRKDISLSLNFPVILLGPIIFTCFVEVWQVSVGNWNIRDGNEGQWQRCKVITAHWSIPYFQGTWGTSSACFGFFHPPRYPRILFSRLSTLGPSLEERHPSPLISRLAQRVGFPAWVD